MPNTMKHTKLILSSVALLTLFGCQSTSSVTNSATPTKNNSNFLTLDGERTNEAYTSWKCRDYVREKNIIVEVGVLEEQKYMRGFVLYDGSSVGERTIYRRVGLNHRWDWGGTSGGDFAFVVKPDGVSNYFDFTNVPEGTTVQASGTYKCRK